MKKTKQSLFFVLIVMLLSLFFIPMTVSADDEACGIDIIPGRPWMGQNNTFFTLWAQNCEGKYWEFTINGETIAYDNTSISNPWSIINIRNLGVGIYPIRLNLYSEAPTADMQDPFGPYEPLPVSYSAVFEIWEHSCTLDIQDRLTGEDVYYDIRISSPNHYDYTIMVEKEVSEGVWEQIHTETAASSGDSVYEHASFFDKGLFGPGSYRSRLKMGYYFEPYTYFTVSEASGEEREESGNGQEIQSNASGGPPLEPGPGTSLAEGEYSGSGNGQDLYRLDDGQDIKSQTRTAEDLSKKGRSKDSCNNPYPNLGDELNASVAIFIDRPREEVLIVERDSFEIVGWAFDTHCCDCYGHRGTGIEYVSIYDEKDNAIACAQYGLVRRDVMQKYGKNYLKSGFMAIIDKADLDVGLNKLTVYAYAPSINSWSKTNINVFIK